MFDAVGLEGEAAGLYDLILYASFHTAPEVTLSYTVSIVKRTSGSRLRQLLSITHNTIIAAGDLLRAACYHSTPRSQITVCMWNVTGGTSPISSQSLPEVRNTTHSRPDSGAGAASLNASRQFVVTSDCAL